ncbi:MAG: hypothetical protein KKF50_05760 [Nanoarchaeota archaeon]|nr:hypothetical protein [Nanoarchaeota archaeon]
MNEKVGAILSYILQALIFVYILIGILERNYLPVIEGVIALFITFLPLILKKRWGIHLPASLNLLIVLSLYLHAEGRLLSFYTLFYPYYDKISHFVGSATVALLGFAMVIIIDRFTKINLNKKAIIFFIIIFTMAIGGFWEILEFTSDSFLGTTHQSNLTDTMLDLIFDLVGGIFIAMITNINYEVMKRQIRVKKRNEKKRI